MDETTVYNNVELCGILAGAPFFSHGSRGERFYQFPMETARLSGTVDRVNIVAREELLQSLEALPMDKIRVTGEIRSFNNRSGEGNRLVITVFARSISFSDDADCNTVTLMGTLCKKPTLRTTPMGREICDMMLAVNRRYGRSDYLPCIAWGLRAKECAAWDVGTRAVIEGRLQSRNYIKTVDGVPVEKTAFEVSVITAEEQA